MANQIGFSNAMKEVVGNNFVTLDELKNDNEIYIPLFKNKLDGRAEAKKILGKLLANNGGGGSSDYVMPKNVIVINPDADEVEGKVYNSFANAKSYMEENPYETFKVELPAGEFNEQITLNQQWEIHGNNTILTAPLKSIITFSTHWNYKYLISDCVISEGFETAEVELDPKYNPIIDNLPLYILNNCTVTKIENDNDITNILPKISIVLMSNGCVNVTQCSDNPLKQCYFKAIGTYVQQLVANRGAYDFMSSYIHGNVSSPNTDHSNSNSISFIGCIIDADIVSYSIETSNLSHIKILSESDLHIRNSSGMCCCSVYKDLTISDSSITIAPYDGETIDKIIIVRSFVSLSKSENNENDRQTVSLILTDAVSDFEITKEPNIWTITYDRSKNNIMYSTDGGVTMSKDSTGATHEGVVINSSNISYDVNNYIWFPMPN